MTRLVGMVLAAGSGRRYGGPKALARHADGTPWLVTAVATLRAGDDARPVTVVLGARSEEAIGLVPAGVGVVVAADWAEGMGASLGAGLVAVGDADAVLVTLVDLPDVGPPVVDRLLRHALVRVPGHLADPSATSARQVLARAAFADRPGHPVLLGADHLAGVAAAAQGDRGARDYLAQHDCTLVECGDLATGRDVDRRP